RTQVRVPVTASARLSATEPNNLRTSIDFSSRNWACARRIPSVDLRSEVGGELQLRVNAEQGTGRWRFRIKVADKAVSGADLDMHGGAVGPVDEHRPNRRGEWIAHR